ncbi:H+/gluconate symporter-like permease [Bradyrhizobium sp. LM3.2]
MGLLGILVGLGLLVLFAFRGWSVLLLAPFAALVAALFGGEPLLANLTQIFMVNAAGFLAQFFPIFLLGAVFGKLMDDSGAVRSVAGFMAQCLGERRVILAVVLAGALVTYGGVSLFVAFFVIVPMAQSLFRAAAIPRRLIPAAIVLGTSTFTMSALPGTPSIQNAIPMPFFGTTPFAAPGLGIVASLIMLGAGLWWLQRAEAAARRAGEGYGEDVRGAAEHAADDELVRERATTAREFDPAEIRHGRRSDGAAPVASAILPLAVVVAVNLVMSLLVLPRLDVSYLSEQRFGGISLAAVAGVWSVSVALGAAIVATIVLNWTRLPSLRQTMDARRQCIGPARTQRCKPRRIRRGHRGAAGFRNGARLGACDRRRSAGLARGRDQYSRCADRLGVGRPDHRARRSRPDLCRPCRAHRRRPLADAPRRGDRLGDAGHPAAQWCRGKPARDLWPDPSRQLFRHRNGRHRDVAAGAGGRDRFGRRVGIVLNGILA